MFFISIIVEVPMLLSRIFPILVITASLVFPGCQKSDVSPTSPASGTTEGVTPSRAGITLTVGMMSAVDAAPCYLAAREGYYADEGVDVELILFTNGQQRQTALQTGQVDGAMTDLVALVTQTASDFRLTGTISTDGDFPLLSSGPLEGKETVSAGTMEISVTNYLLEQYLGANHIVEKVFINEIPTRLEAVASQQLDTGIFPEPFASIGELRGLQKIRFEGIPSESLNIIAFTDEAIEEKRDQIAAFHRAYARAVQDLQKYPDLARDLLLSVIPNLPKEIRSTMHIPSYQPPRLPSDAFTKEIMDWTESVTRTQYTFEPSELFDRQFVEAY